MTTGIQTPTPGVIDQTQKNSLAFAAIGAVEALFYAYDPTEKLDDSIIEDMVWQIENALIDFTYEIEDIVEHGVEEDSMPPHPLSPDTVVAQDAIEIIG